MLGVCGVAEIEVLTIKELRDTLKGTPSHQAITDRNGNPIRIDVEMNPETRRQTTVVLAD